MFPTQIHLAILEDHSSIIFALFLACEDSPQPFSRLFCQSLQLLLGIAIFMGNLPFVPNYPQSPISFHKHRQMHHSVLYSFILSFDTTDASPNLHFPIPKRRGQNARHITSGQCKYIYSYLFGKCLGKVVGQMGGVPLLTCLQKTCIHHRRVI
jgi:hypothetical protein